MNKDEALKMAIEAMKNSKESWHQIGIYDSTYDGLVNAINACKEALEQPAQEPVAWMMVHREPEHGAAYLTFDKPTRNQKISHHPHELYTHPHQFIGLTDDEINKLNPFGYADEYELEFARAIEQALRIKNESR
jgi:hypothetical protein